MVGQCGQSLNTVPAAVEPALAGEAAGTAAAVVAGTDTGPEAVDAGAPGVDAGAEAGRTISGGRRSDVGASTAAASSVATIAVTTANQIAGPSFFMFNFLSGDDAQSPASVAGVMLVFGHAAHQLDGSFKSAHLGRYCG